MIDRMGAFTSQFQPVDGGYLYYPSRNGGGKFVSVEEYDRLVSSWRRATGRRATWIFVGLTILAVTLWSIAPAVFELPAWTESIVTMVCVAAISGWILWAGFAPHRLVASRPDISPPRPRELARRQARAMVGWPMVLLALFFSGAIFLLLMMSREGTTSWWAWAIGSGLMFAAYLWLGLRKLTDRPR